MTHKDMVSKQSFSLGYREHVSSRGSDSAGFCFDCSAQLDHVLYTRFFWVLGLPTIMQDMH